MTYEKAIEKLYLCPNELFTSLFSLTAQRFEKSIGELMGDYTGFAVSQPDWPLYRKRVIK